MAEDSKPFYRSEKQSHETVELKNRNYGKVRLCWQRTDRKGKVLEFEVTSNDVHESSAIATSSTAQELEDMF